MKRNIVRRWAFVIAGILFLIAALVPFAERRTFNAAFFVLGIAFLVVGAAIARRNRGSSPPSGGRGEPTG
jgi:uncharacterized membrane protein HdeD (DUF308 family)